MKTKRANHEELQVESLSADEALESVLQRAGLQKAPASRSDRIRVATLAKMRDERRPRKLSEG